MILEWLKGPALIRIAELICVNRGKLNLTEVGKVEPTQENRYGRFGLTFPEACELQYLRGMFEGILIATNHKDAQAAKDVIQREINGLQIEIATPDQVAMLLTRKSVKV